MSLVIAKTFGPHQEGAPWSKEEASKYLGISTRTLERYIKAKLIRSIQFGRLVKIPDDEIKRIAKHGLNHEQQAERIISE